jgi:hypothetical protein
VLSKEFQGPGPGSLCRLLMVPGAGEVHETMVSPRVGVELVLLAQPSFNPDSSI